MDLLRLPASLALVAILGVAACKKKETPPPAPAPTPAPASQAAPAPAATSAAATSLPAAKPLPAEPTPEERALAEKRAALERAMTEDLIANDPRGQWASTAKASSRYGSGDGYAPEAATGAPDVERYSDSRQSWASLQADKGLEWLEVGFAKPVHATAIRVRQNLSPGAIVKIELIAEDGSRQTVFSDVDTTVYPPNTIVWFSRTFEKTEKKITGARITLATNSVPGWNEIDAVQLVGE